MRRATLTLVAPRSAYLQVGSNFSVVSLKCRFLINNCQSLIHSVAESGRFVPRGRRSLEGCRCQTDFMG